MTGTHAEWGAFERRDDAQRDRQAASGTAIARGQVDESGNAGCAAHRSRSSLARGRGRGCSPGGHERRRSIQLLLANVGRYRGKSSRMTPWTTPWMQATTRPCRWSCVPDHATGLRNCRHRNAWNHSTMVRRAGWLASQHATLCELVRPGGNPEGCNPEILGN